VTKKDNEEGENKSKGEEDKSSEMAIDAPEKPAEQNGEIKNSYHKTESLYIGEVPEAIPHSELEEFGANYAGYRRTYVQITPSNKYWNSRAWIIFNLGVDINQICSDFRKHVFSNGSTLLCSISNPPQFRIRPSSGITNHKDVMRKDLENAAKLVLLYDAKWGLFGPNAPELCEKPNMNDLKYESGNPLLKNITNLIVDELDYDEVMTVEETEMKKSTELAENPFKSNMPLIKFVTDDKLKPALDQILIYLRIVHSIDYYSATQVSRETLGPHVLGFFHSRADFVHAHINKKDYDGYVQTHNHRLFYILRNDPFLEQKDIDYATFRDPEVFVSEFITTNSKEISPEKWKCLICEKKFRDSPFLVKHINNKHMDLLDKVRSECSLFNNYMKDPQRPGIYIYGMGKLTGSKRNNETAFNTDSTTKTNTIYNNAVSSLSSNPVLMATFINQAIASSNVGKVPNAAIGGGHRFNQMQERRSITSYNDVDNQN